VAPRRYEFVAAQSANDAAGAAVAGDWFPPSLSGYNQGAPDLESRVVWQSKTSARTAFVIATQERTASIAVSIARMRKTQA